MIMMDILYLIGIVIAVILAFMPWAIYREMKRQGAERAAEAARIIALLSVLRHQHTDARRCWSCGTAVAREAENCPSCGSLLGPE